MRCLAQTFWSACGTLLCNGIIYYCERIKKQPKNKKNKKPRKIDNLLYRHFKQTNHSTCSISIQPVEKITYGDNSTKRYRNILRHKIELKWIKLLQKPHPLGFNDNIYHEGNISRLPDFDVFSLLDIRKRNKRSHGKRKNENLKCKNKHVFTLSELSIILKHSG